MKMALPFQRWNSMPVIFIFIVDVIWDTNSKIRVTKLLIHHLFYFLFFYEWLNCVGRFLYKVKIYCNANFYTSDCGVYCKPRDNTQGHYGCNQTTGAKMCHDGWEGKTYYDCFSLRRYIIFSAIYLKTLATIGNRQRLIIFLLGVSQHAWNIKSVKIWGQFGHQSCKRTMKEKSPCCTDLSVLQMPNKRLQA